jgi:hypothetical protein
MPRYTVMVDDNFHYQDEDERYEHGIYETVDAALAACRNLVERSLSGAYEPGMSAEDLYKRYTSFGEDPFIVVLDGVDDRARFSAWTFAEERCREICGGPPTAPD